MTKKQRRELMMRVWHGHVGELPEEGVSKICSWAASYGIVVAMRAIDRASRYDGFETSDDVLMAAEVILRGWRQRGWCGIGEQGAR